MSRESNHSIEQVKTIVMEHNETHQNSQLEVINTSELIDIRNYYVCTYGDNEVDIFTKKLIQSTTSANGRYYYTEAIYNGYSSNQTAIYSLHEGYHLTNYYLSVGKASTWDNKIYKVTCVLNYKVSFDGIRQIMKDIGEINEFIPGKATRDEINAVLCFAKKYYAPKINVENLYVCTWGENQMGLFTQYAPQNKDYADNVYIGYNTNHTGIFTINDCDRGGNINTWEPIGYRTVWDSKAYLATCNMNGSINFDSIREMMRKDGAIKSYSVGKATKEEISIVFSWAADHYTQIKQQIEVNQPQKGEIIHPKKTTDVSVLYICAFDNRVGLFTKKVLDEKDRANLWYYYPRSEDIYLGYQSDKVGIFTTMSGKTTTNEWRERGYRTFETYYRGLDKYYNYYIANCNMTDAISFDEMRQIMYTCGEIPGFEYGIATDEEIQEVLKYAKEYFEPKDSNVRARKPQ